MADEPVVLQESVTKGAEYGGDSALEEVEFAPLIDYFGMDRPTLDEKNSLRDLLASLHKQGATTKGELLQKLRDIDMRLGQPPTGENRIRRIVNFLRIDEQVADLIKEQTSYVRG